MNRTLIALLFSAFALLGMSEELHTSIRHLTRQNGLTNDRVTVLEQDHHGYIWAGTENGLNRISDHEVYTWQDTGHPLYNIHISAIEADKASNCLWVFTPQGMVGCIDLTDYRLVPHTPEKADSLLCHHHKGKLYMWQYGPTRRCNRIRLNKGKLSMETFKIHLTDICTDDEGGDWLLTTQGLYLNGFKEKLPESDNVTHITTYRNICLALTPHEVIAYNHSRRITRRAAFPKGYHGAGQCTDLATWGNQLLIFTPDKTITYQILDDTFSTPSNGQIKNGQVLPESGRHIYVYDGQGKLIRFGEDGSIRPLQLMPAEVARQSDGQTMPQVATINATSEAFSTYGNGLIILNTQTGKSKHYRQGEAHGIIHDNRIHALLTDHTGCLWIATEKAGISCLLPLETETLTPVKTPQPHISSIIIDGEESLITTDEMELPYTHNNIEWHFSSMTYDQLEAIQYQYYLEGIDTTWQAPTHDYKAAYRELPPGRYIFHVRTYLDDNRWSRESTHTVVISEPWWNQWPAYLTALTLVAAMGIFLYLIIYRFIHPERAETAPVPQEAPPTQQKEDITPEEPEQPQLTPRDERFRQLLEETMKQHIEDPTFGVEEFAASTNLKRTQFYTKVKRITGMSPIELLRKAHLQHAARLLLETDLTIDEVRERCGFSNSTTFYNYFKQQFGMTPRQYRNQL